jgi:uncharacterized protein (DUF1330 family)
VAGFVIADVAWFDDAGRRRYVDLLGPTLQAHGGEIVAADGHARVLEGDWQPEGLLVVVRFPSAGAADAWYASPEYQEALRVRQAAARSRVLRCGE